jgi:ubiquinone/menaquinone biosynthesis C-methylase UbiE
MSVEKFRTWEQAVEWLITQPDQENLVKACYYDRPVKTAAERFWASEEWQATRSLLPTNSGKVLDVGAGSGISSFALAKEGWHTTALEPDSSNTVGAGAIRTLSKESNLSIDIVQGYGEQIPLPDANFELVYARQALHHANDLHQLCRELFRVLKPGGTLLAVREHVISSPKQLDTFLSQHPLHQLYGGENAYTLSQYKTALEQAGFSLLKIIKPFDSVINFAPHSKASLKQELKRYFAKLPAGQLLGDIFFSDSLFNLTLQILSRIDQRPGRAYSFVAYKPE